MITEIKTLTAIKNGENVGIKVFPNPTSSIINIQAPMGNESWEMYNALGMKVKEGEENTIQVYDLEPGTYILKVSEYAYQVVIR